MTHVLYGPTTHTFYQVEKSYLPVIQCLSFCTAIHLSVAMSFFCLSISLHFFVRPTECLSLSFVCMNVFNFVLISDVFHLAFVFRFDCQIFTESVGTLVFISVFLSVYVHFSFQLSFCFFKFKLTDFFGYVLS